MDTRRPRLGGCRAATSTALPALARYLAIERRGDGRPLDSVARFHLGNGATVWRLNWPANTAPEAWRQSYGAMVNYRYEPDALERRHEDFVRRRTRRARRAAARGPAEGPGGVPNSRHVHSLERGEEHSRWRPSRRSTGPSPSRRSDGRTRRSSSCPTGAGSPTVRRRRPRTGSPPALSPTVSPR